MTPKEGKKLLGADALEAAALDVATRARAASVRAALVGGYAMHLYGSDRLTANIDFIADRWIKGFVRGKDLTFGGAQTVASNGAPLDLIIRDDQYAELYGAALDACVPVTGRSPLRIVTAEHLAAMKLVAHRPRDLLDLEVLVLNAVNVDKARRLIRKHLGAFAADELDRYVDEFRWRAKKGK